ncbi:unnamed protein product [Brassica oleracea]|uniref:(rape) hypothetical protein n=1 Tax=Brassica napus TaxID=3708 RepID=A0A816UUY8_BRANA|nr:unnamed protein product [Brassica napus]
MHYFYSHSYTFPSAVLQAYGGSRNSVFLILNISTVAIFF